MAGECPDCGEFVEPGTVECPFCGHAFAPTEEPAAAESHSLTGSEAFLEQWHAQFEERRLYVAPELAERARQLLSTPKEEVRRTSAVFADLVGFSKASLGKSPEDISLVIRKFHQLALDVTTLYRGFVVRFQADGIFLIFGAPMAYDADTMNAVLAAREIVQRVTEITWPDGEPLAARGGVGTGRVHMTIQTGGGEAFLLIGDSINLGARLEAKAPHGGVLVCRDTAKVIHGRFAMEETEPLVLKNMSDDYRAMILKEELHDDVPRVALEVGYVGREAELETLTNHISAPGFVTGELCGEAGIGKTRMMRELASKMSATHAFVILENVPHGQNILLYPQMRWLRERLGIRAGASDTEINDAISRFFYSKSGALNIEDSVLAGYVLGLRHAVDLLRQQDPKQLRENLFRFFVDLYRSEAEGRELIIVVDDMHWADVLTTRWVKWLRGQRPDNTKLLILTRSEVSEEETEIVTEVDYDFTIDLKPLDEEGRKALLSQIFGEGDELPARVMDLLKRRAGGNPLYELELTNALREIAADRGGNYPEEDELPRLLPDSIWQVIQWRLDRLNDRTRLVLQTGAVFGIEFQRNLLELLEVIREGLKENLKVLQSMQYFQEIHRLSEELLRFQHEVTRDVAYEMMPTEQRRKIHEEVAECYENTSQQPEAEVCEVLAWHWTRAGNDDRAVHWLLKASDRRMRLGAALESIEAARQAIALIDKSGSDERSALVKRMRLLAKMGMQQVSLGDFNEAEKSLRDSEAAASKAEAAPGIAEARLWLAITAYQRGELDQADALFDKCEKLVQTPNLERLYTRWLLGKALISAQQNRPKDADEFYQTAEKVALDKKDSQTLSDVLNNRGLIAWGSGMRDKAREMWERALPHRADVADLAGKTITLMHLAVLHHDAGETNEALRRYEEATELATRIGHRQALAALTINRADLFKQLGRYGDAAEEASRAVEASAKVGDKRLGAYAENNLAQALLGLDQRREAIVHAKRASDLLEGAGDSEAEVAISLTLVEAELEDKESAEKLRHRLDKLQLEIENVESLTKLKPRVLRVRALLVRKLGDDASEALKNAQTCAEELNDAGQLVLLREQFGEV